MLGRLRSKTLQLTETARGLEFSISLPDTTLANDIRALAERGDLSGCSIGFRAVDEQWPTPSSRTLKQVQLIEVSVITGGVPAYEGTSVAVRHRCPASNAYLRRARLLEAAPWAG